MEPPSLPKHVVQDSKKRLLSSSGVCMDPDVVEIPPPVRRSLRNRQKQVVFHEVIDIDKYEEPPEVMIIDEKVDQKNKGKMLSSSFAASEIYKDKGSAIKALGSENKVESSKSFALGSHDLAQFDSDSPYDDDYLDYINDFMAVDDYAILQSHFDNVDIPAGVEADIPWFPCYSESKMQTSSWSAHIEDPSLSAGMLELADVNKATSVSSSSVQAQVTSVSSSSMQTQVTAANDSSEANLYRQSAQSKKKSIISHEAFWKPSKGSSSTSNSNMKQHNVKNLTSDVDPLIFGLGPFSLQNPVGTSSSIRYPTAMNAMHFHQIKELPIPWSAGMTMPWKPTSLTSLSDYSNRLNQINNACVTPQELADIRSEKVINEEDILRKFQLFKKFDTVEDYSDHHYASTGFSGMQPPKHWVKKIQDEWRILEKDLPDTIFVRAYETRMDLLRAVIIGAESTPYHDGLFFFDVYFPDDYPSVPPLVHYHSGGLRLNPNLYGCGKVCLSLLNTWSGHKTEKWIPGTSTMLQVLVSIQALILNQKPYFNEPGYARLSGTPKGEILSQQYNEDTFILSLRTMVYTMKKIPKHFEDFVVGHFYQRANDILVACKAYMEGAQVGCVVKGGVQDVDEGDKSCSQKFKDALAGCMNMIVKELTRIGAKDTEKFLIPASSGQRKLFVCPNGHTFEA